MTNFNIFMLFRVSYKIISHHMMMNLNMYVCAYGVSGREHLYVLENFWKDTQKIAKCDYL